MKHHVGPKGPSPCKATKGKCPFGGEENHYPTKEAAEKAFELSMTAHLLPKVKKPAFTEELLASGSELYPRETLIRLGRLLEEKPYTTLSVLPAGSALYNTSIPGREAHDYDFTVFSSPHPALRKHKQVMEGELDVNFINVAALPKLAARSTPLSEAIFAQQRGRALTALPNDPYAPMFAAFRIPETKYFDLVDDVTRSKNQQFVEPVTQDAPVNFRNFKHTVRWTIYQKRWGKSGGPFDPRLTDEERELFLHTLKEGRLQALFD